jgi:hypothetical protein
LAAAGSVSTSIRSSFFLSLRDPADPGVDVVGLGCLICAVQHGYAVANYISTWDELMAVVKSAVDAVAVRAPG